MHSLRRISVLLLLAALAKAEVPSPFHPVVDVNPSCPQLVSYYRRLERGAAGEGGAGRAGCHRCYCRDNGTAACWPREERRCPAETTPATQNQKIRVRRGLFGLSNLLLGSAASKFFKEELPKECVPKTSFSDGCPPSDWCVGCTVCDCDSDGRWDCHIMSFCNGDEKKRRINGSKVPVPKSIKSLNSKTHSPKAAPKQASKTKRSLRTTKKPKPVKRTVQKPKQTKKNRTKPPPKKVVLKKAKKVILKKKPTVRSKRTQRTKKPKVTKKTKPTKKPKTTIRTKPKPKTTTEEPQEQTTYHKRRGKKGSKTHIRKVIHRVLSKRDSNPDLKEISDAMNADKEFSQSQIGRKIVKKVISTIEKLMAKQMAMVQNKTNSLRSQHKDCPQAKVVKKKKKKEKPKEKTKYQMTIEEIRDRKMEAYINRNSWRVKREVLYLEDSENITQTNESKLHEATNDYMDLSVKELEKNGTEYNLESNISDSTTIPNVSDPIIINNELTTKVTEIIMSTDRHPVLNSTESDFKYYEYLYEKNNKTNATAKILSDNYNTENYNETTTQNVISKLSETITENSLVEDLKNKSILNVEVNDNVLSNTTDKPKNIIENNEANRKSQKEHVNSTLFGNTSQIITTDNPKIITGGINKIISDEKKHLHYYTGKPKLRQGNKAAKTKHYPSVKNVKKYNDSRYKWDKVKLLKDITNHHKVINTTTQNRSRIPNGTIDDAELIKRIKNKIKNRNAKKFGAGIKHDSIISKDTIMKSASYGTLNNFSSSSKNNITKKIYDKNSFQYLLENLMNQKKDSVSKTEQKPKYSIFKYLRNIFKKIFSKKKETETTHKTNEGYTLEVLCENRSACFKNEHIKLALRSKLHDLNSETEKVFQSIKIIKNMLHLIDIPTNISDDSTEKFLNNDIKKLNAILKGNYYENSSLSVAEESQIQYVKENIHNFIVSVGKFATILNEVLDELYKNNKKYSCQRNLRLNRKNNSKKTLNKIKKLLINYKIVQNTFMKKIFQLIRNSENNTSSETPPEPFKKNDSRNNTPVIDTYTTNIIEHLRKLKNLAQALNSTRKKRWTSKNNDAMEFMLLMLEYLIKQNHSPPERMPANDGIDLLIEAIQNAPTIKPIKKKVLSYIPKKLEDTHLEDEKDYKHIEAAIRTTTMDDSSFLNSELTKEIKFNPTKGDSSALNNDNILVDRTLDQEEDNTETVYQRLFEKNDTSADSNDFYKMDDTVSDQNESLNDENVGFAKFERNVERVQMENDNAVNENDEKTVNETGITKLESIKSEIKISNVSEASDDNENNYQTTVITDAPTPRLRTDVETTLVPWEDYKLDVVPVNNGNARLDWIEENLGKEINVYQGAESVNYSAAKSVNYSEAVATTGKSVDNISSITVEIEEEKKIKRKTDRILRRKEMELLNSLDYGTDRPDFDDSYSKDEPKFSREKYPAYFTQ